MKEITFTLLRNFELRFFRRELYISELSKLRVQAYMKWTYQNETLVLLLEECAGNDIKYLKQNGMFWHPCVKGRVHWILKYSTYCKIPEISPPNISPPPPQPLFAEAKLNIHSNQFDRWRVTTGSFKSNVDFLFQQKLHVSFPYFLISTWHI